MICEKYFEIGVVGLVEGGVDVVVVCAGVGGVLYFEIFYKYKILYYLYLLNLSIFAKETSDGGFGSLVQPTNIQLSHQNTLVDLLWRLSLQDDFLPFGLT